MKAWQLNTQDSTLASKNIYVDITFKGNAMDFPGWCLKAFRTDCTQVLQ